MAYSWVSPSKSGDKFYRGSSASSHWVKDLLWQKHTQKEKRVYQIAEEDNVPLHAQSVSNTVKIFKEKKKVQQEQDRKEARAARKVPALNTSAVSGAGLDGRPLTASLSVRSLKAPVRAAGRPSSAQQSGRRSGRRSGRAVQQAAAARASREVSRGGSRGGVAGPARADNLKAQLDAMRAQQAMWETRFREENEKRKDLERQLTARSERLSAAGSAIASPKHSGRSNPNDAAPPRAAPAPAASGGGGVDMAAVEDRVETLFKERLLDLLDQRITAMVERKIQAMSPGKAY